MPFTLEKLKQHFGLKMTTPELEAVKELEITRLELFGALIALDLAQAQVDYHRAKIARLGTFLDGGAL